MYKHGETADNLFKNTGEVEYTHYGKNVDLAFVEEGTTLYIYFQGSDEVSDWFFNFFFAKKPYKDMRIAYRVHAGFLKCWKAVEDAVIARIKYMKYHKIVTVGYSHGATLAMLCHECVWYYRPDIRDVSYTVAYGGPRVYAGFRVKKDLKRRWDSFYLFRNGDDIVTHLPPRLFGFTHVGHIIDVGTKNFNGFIEDHLYREFYPALVEWSKLHEFPIKRT